MRSRLVPVFIAVAVFLVAALVGRYLILPMFHGSNTVTVQRAAPPADGRLETATTYAPASSLERPEVVQLNMSVFDECMTEALARRVDPIEARHTCDVIADNI